MLIWIGIDGIGKKEYAHKFIFSIRCSPLGAWEERKEMFFGPSKFLQNTIQKLNVIFWA